MAPASGAGAFVPNMRSFGRQSGGTPFSPGGASDASSSLFSRRSEGVGSGFAGQLGGGGSGFGSYTGGGGAGGGGFPAGGLQSGNVGLQGNWFVAPVGPQDGAGLARASTGGSLPPGAIHEEHHQHHSWNSRTQVRRFRIH